MPRIGNIEEYSLQQFRNQRVKDALLRYASIEDYLRMFTSKLNSFQETKESYDGLIAARIQEVNNLSNKTSDPILKTILRTTDNLLHTVKYFDKEIDNITRNAICVTKALLELDTIDYKIIELRYLQKIPVQWDKICEILNVKVKFLHRRHGQALIDLSSKL